MDHRFPAAGMTPILSLIFCLSASPAPASPAKGCIPELLISSDSIVQNRRPDKERLLVDIRPAAAFEKLRVPGSLNIPLFEIKTKTFLKKYDLVIIDEGYRHAQIEDECRSLLRAGFRLRILNGGLSVWSRKGGLLKGDEFARRTLNRLSPLNFHMDKDSGNWIVLVASEGGRPDPADLFPRFVSMPYAGEGRDFAARYGELLKREMNTPCVRILVVDERGAQYGRLEGIIRTTAFPDVFFLEGGLEGYRKFVEGVNASHKKVPTAPKRNCCGGDP